MPTFLAYIAEWAGVIAVIMLLVLSPRFQRRPLIFKYPRREALVALGLAAVLIAAWWMLFRVVALPAPDSIAGKEGFIYTLDELLRQVLFSFASAGLFYLALLVRQQPLLSAGLHPKTFKNSLQLGFALSLLSIFLRGKIGSIVEGVTPAHGYYLIAMLALAFANEFIFRGFIQPRLSAWWGEIPGWLAAAVLFTAANLPQLFLSASAMPMTLRAASLLAFGLVQGYAMRKTGNIAGLTLYHAVHNWIMAF